MAWSPLGGGLPVKPDEVQPMLGGARGVVDKNPPMRGCKQFCIGCGGCCCCSLLILIITVAICASKAVPSNITEEFIRQQLGGEEVYGWWSPPALQPPSVLAELRQELDRDTVLDPVGIHENMTFGFGDAAKITRLMYSATKVEGVWEKVPHKLRGVFWMKGNGIAEELTVFQYGSWFQTEQMYLVPMAPFSWAWAGGKPEEAPFGGKMYGFEATMAAAFSILGNGDPATTLSFRWGMCPSGKACETGSTDLTHADLQFHMRDLRDNDVNMKSMLDSPGRSGPAWLAQVTGHYALEEVPHSVQPGSHWRRSINWSIGGCECFAFGDYDLVKIIDADGEPLQPAYDDFIAYMGEVDLFVWSGFKAGTQPPPRTRQPTTPHL
eukprot:CAMPEP_0203915896 /NCGR_PEP_ID=MMETSP0359-20131031/56624_1 /ASSEMBLY_ACC=CAM_ASM_000338 /TAXON_ID=268821 /ORGANISM="Scrippsiella Hangoei, Strain SHTV-5" /LENGTH=379 /DNA_ID=CAMNT_0050842481 /DNA_START=38 /DNA_END=1177 /DNA_ORIENTATION=-